MKPTITIGVPFYNCENTLASAVRSIFAQSFQDWELILLDDGSTDRSLDIARSIRDVRVSVFSDGVNKGIGARRKEIVERAAGEYVAWQDADDLMHPDRLSIELDFLEHHPAVSVVDTLSYRFDETNHVLGVNPAPTEPFTPAFAVKRCLLLNGSTLARRQMYVDNPFDPSLRRSEDWDVFRRAIQTCAFDRISKPLYFRRHFEYDKRMLLHKELINVPFELKMIWRHGPGQFGSWGAFIMIGKRFPRYIARTVCTVLGLRQFVPGARLLELSDSEMDTAKHAVQLIMETKIPGLDA